MYHELRKVSLRMSMTCSNYEVRPRNSWNEMPNILLALRICLFRKHSDKGVKIIVKPI